MNKGARHILMATLSVSASNVWATDYHAHGLIGAYQAKESVKDGTGKTISNDQSAMLGRLYFDATRIGGVRSQFTLDIRDKYDAFGVTDQDRPRLVQANFSQVRQLALKYPFESGQFYAAVGRVPIMDAALLANDGVDMAYRMTTHLRMGIFGGYYPELHYGTQPSFDAEVPQIGIYSIYDDKSPGWDKHTLISSSLVSRQYPAAESGTADAVVGGERANPHLLLYGNAVHQASSTTRYTGMAQVDLSPQPFARNIWLGWHSLLSSELSSSVSLIRIDATGYDRQRDALDKMAPSVLTRVSADLRQRMSREWTVLYDGALGSRALDGKIRVEGGGRLLRSGLLKSRLNVYGGAGFRRNYLSQDFIGRAGASYVWKNYDLGIHQQFVMQQHDAGNATQSFVTDVTGSTLFGDNILGTFTVEYAQGSSASVMSGMAGVGFRLGSGQATPPGASPVPPTPVERL